MEAVQLIRRFAQQRWALCAPHLTKHNGFVLMTLVGILGLAWPQIIPGDASASDAQPEELFRAHRDLLEAFSGQFLSETDSQTPRSIEQAEATDLKPVARLLAAYINAHASARFTQGVGVGVVSQNEFWIRLTDSDPVVFWDDEIINFCDRESVESSLLAQGDNIRRLLKGLIRKVPALAPISDPAISPVKRGGVPFLPILFLLTLTVGVGGMRATAHSSAKCPGISVQEERTEPCKTAGPQSVRMQSKQSLSDLEQMEQTNRKKAVAVAEVCETHIPSLDSFENADLFFSGFGSRSLKEATRTILELAKDSSPFPLTVERIRLDWQRLIDATSSIVEAIENLVPYVPSVDSAIRKVWENIEANGKTPPEESFLDT